MWLQCATDGIPRRMQLRPLCLLAKWSGCVDSGSHVTCADTIRVGSGRHRGPEDGGVPYIPQQQLAEESISVGPGAPVGAAAAESADRARHEAAHLGLVGRRAPHQLLRRLAHGVRVSDSAVVLTGLAAELLVVLPSQQSTEAVLHSRRWAWCLPCGRDSIVPYFYVIYFAILLCAPSLATIECACGERHWSEWNTDARSCRPAVHRDRRDDHACKLKYGKDWDRYCDIVKYRIVPLVY